MFFLVPRLTTLGFDTVVANYQKSFIENENYPKNLKKELLKAYGTLHGNEKLEVIPCKREFIFPSF